MSDDFNSILEQLKAKQDSETKQLFVPSTNEKLMFKPLTVNQQKSIINSTLQGMSSIMALNNAFNQIIETSCTRS